MPPRRINLALLTALAISILFAPRIPVSQASLRHAKTSAENGVTIPFELINNHIHFRVKVNNTLLSFVLDTGDKYGIIDLDKAKRLGLDLQGEIASSGGGEGVMMGRMVHGASFSVIGLEGFAQPIEMAMPFDDLAHVGGHDFDGLLGQKFISQFVVEIDYIGKTLKLFDKAKYFYYGSGESIPITFNTEGHPEAQAEIMENGREPVAGRFVLDIGYSGPLMLNKRFVIKESLLRPDLKTISTSGGYGVGGESKAFVGRIRGLKLGHFTIDNPVTAFSQDTRGGAAALPGQGLIGAEVLSKFKVILDYNRNRIILEPNSRFAEPITYDTTGLRLMTRAANYSEVRIYRVVADSPAAKAGVSEGDILIAINGRSTAEFTITQMREMFRQEKLFDLQLKRGDKLIKVKLKSCRMI